MIKMNETGETIYDKIKTRLYEMIVERIKNGKHVLDVGCGECKLTTYLAKATKRVR